MKLLGRMYDKLIERYESKVRREFNGIPVAYVVYDKTQPPPNVYFVAHPEIKDDEYICNTMKRLAGYIRENYGDKL